MSSLEIDNLSVFNGRHPILQQLSFPVESGEFVALMGPSGAGKTTLLRAIAGLQPVTEGTIRIDGEDVTTSTPHRRRVSVVMDEAALFSHRTVAANLALAQGRDHSLLRSDQVDAAIATVGVTHLLDLYPGQLSTGERQKVALVRALLTNPGVMLFDEPLAHVDAPSATQLMAAIRQAHWRLDAATVFITHSVSQAFQLADRIIYLRHGRILQDASCQDVHDGPASLAIARHFGATIQLATTADISVDRVGQVWARARLLGQDLTVAAHEALAAAVGTNVAVVLVGHPQAVRLEGTATATGVLSVAGPFAQVSDFTYRGEDYLVDLETELGVIATTVGADQMHLLRGERVRVKLVEQRLWALPQASVDADYSAP